MKQNCWEFMQCGRDKSSGAGACPAMTENKADGLNQGTNGGRVCWAVAGTHCYGEKQGTYAEKVLVCRECDFRWKVLEEEGPKFRQIYFVN